MQILAVNAIGRESGLSLMAAEGDLPLLQDSTSQEAWTAWKPTYRDVWVLDGQNRRVGVVNLTEENLSNPDSRARMKALLVEAGSR